MNQLARQDYSNAPAVGSGLGQSRQGRRALQQIEAQAELGRVLDVQRGRASANRIDVNAAVGARAMERRAQLIDYKRALANGDMETEMALTQHEQAAGRGILAEQYRLSNPVW